MEDESIFKKDDLTEFIESYIYYLGSDWWDNKLYEFERIPFKNSDKTIVDFDRVNAQTYYLENNSGPVIEETIETISFDIIDYGLNGVRLLSNLRILTNWQENEVDLKVNYDDFETFKIKLFNKLEKIVSSMTIDSGFIQFYENILFLIEEELYENIKQISDQNYEKVCKQFLIDFKKEFLKKFKNQLSAAKQPPSKVRQNKIDLSFEIGQLYALSTLWLHLCNVKKERSTEFLQNICDTYTVKNKNISFKTLASKVRQIESGSSENKLFLKLSIEINTLHSQFNSKSLKKK